MIVLKNFFITYKIEISIFVLALCISFSAFYFDSIRFQNDDQFTIYRYIENLASGKGFVFNEGERVLGSTTPLFTLLGALLKIVFSQVSTQLLIALLNTILIASSAVMFFRLSALFISGSFRYVAVGVYILNLAKTASTGMESPLFIVATLSFLYASFTQRNVIGALWLGVALLTRPDALLIAVLAFVFWVTRNGYRSAIQYTAIVVAIVLPWIIFATVYFNSPVPQSLRTKSHAEDIVYQPRIQAMKVQLAHMSRIYWGKVVEVDNIPIQTLLNLLPFLFFVSIACRRFGRSYWLLFAVPIFYFISFSYSNPVMYPWYISQLEPFWILVSIMGIFVCYEYLARKVPQYRKIILGLVSVVVLCGPIIGYAHTVLPRGEGSKIALYRMALYVKEHKQPGDTVGLSNIGIVSHTLMDTYIYDFVGLTRGDTLQYYPITDECLVKNQYVIPPQMVMDMQPDWIIAGEAEWVPCFVSGEWFLSHYKPAYTTGVSAHVWQKIK